MLRQWSPVARRHRQIRRWERGLIALGLACIASGCSDHEPTTATANAKCVSAMYDQLKTPSGVRLISKNIQVARLSGHRLRVTAFVTSANGGRPHGYVCVVSPDPTDKLRGLRIDRLQVTPSRW
jgi:hypothetical protein